MANNPDVSGLPNAASYRLYKRNTSTLVRWVVTTAALCITPEPYKKPNNNPKHKKRAAQAAHVAHVKAHAPEISTSKLVSLSTAIGEAGRDVPDAIFALFDSVIAARTAAHKIWVSIAAAHPDDKIEKSNSGHRAFIEALRSAYDALGGLKRRERNHEEREREWKTKDNADEETPEKTNAKAGPGGDENVFKFANQFEALVVEPLASEDEVQLEEMANQYAEPTDNDGIPSVGAGPKRKGKAKRAAIEPLESYKMTSDTESYFAVCFFVKDLISLRRYTSNLWRQVGLGQLHCAVAGALSNVAVGMMKSIQYELAMDYHGCTYYRAIIDHLVRNGDYRIIGDDKQSNGSAGNAGKDTNQVAVIAGWDAAAIEENLLLATHNDLVTFIIDYRKNRTGKPSSILENMSWNPNFRDTKFTPRQDLTPQSLRKWKAEYTISWLYDLVNTHAGERLRSDKPKLKDLEKLSWDCDEYGMSDWTNRQLWGPLEFASDITHLAMQTSKAPVEEALKPHHVLQLQIAVDSMFHAKRWTSGAVPSVDCYDSTNSTLIWDSNTDIIEPATMREQWLLSTEQLMDFFKSNRGKSGSSTDWSHPLLHLGGFLCDFTLLAKSPVLSWSLAPESLFSQSSNNGLWLYSPYLCGTGMVDAIQLSYDWGTKVWDRSGYMVSFFHLYNMLRQNGQIENPIDLIDQLIEMFKDDIFAGGRPPTRRFRVAFNLTINMRVEHLSDPSKMRRGKGGELAARTTPFFRKKGKVNDHEKFIKQSKLYALSKVNWLVASLDRKQFPCTSQSKSSVTDILDALKVDIEEDIIGPNARATLNYNFLLTAVCKIFDELDSALDKLTEENPSVRALRETLEKSEQRSSKLISSDITGKILNTALTSALLQDRHDKRLDSPVLSCLGECLERSWKTMEPRLRKNLFFGDEARRRCEKDVSGVTAAMKAL